MDSRVFLNQVRKNNKPPNTNILAKLLIISVFWFYHNFFLKDVNNSGAFYNFLSTNSDFKELFTEVRQIRYARADTVGLLTFVQLIVF